MKKSKTKGITGKRKKIKEWVGHEVFDKKTGENEWKMSRNQEAKDYRTKSLKGEHLHTPRRNWKKGFERLAHNLASKNKQVRRNEKKDKIKKET